MSILSDKILSYSPEVYRPYNDTTISTAASKFGTLTSDTLALSAASQISYFSEGPVGGSLGSWKFTKILSTGDSYVSQNQTSTIAALTDRDYSIGYWFKFDSFPTYSTNATLNLFTVGNQASTGAGFTLSYYGTGAGADARKLAITTQGVTTKGTQIPDDGAWHYIALRRFGNDFTVYLDGVVALTATNTNTTAATTFLYPGIAAFPQNAYFINVSNFYLAPASTIDATAISEIWTAGSTPTGDINPGPLMTTSALMVDPVVSTQSTTTLFDVIMGYGPEIYCIFNETPNFTNYNTPYLNGSYKTADYLASSNGAFSQNNGDSVYPQLNATGGVRGTGSWALSFGGTTDSAPANYQTTLRTTGASGDNTAPMNDYNFSYGFWFKTNFTLTTSLVHDTLYSISTFGETHTNTVVSLYGGTANNASKGKLSVSGTGFTGTNISTQRVDDQQWHFFATRVTVSGSTTTHSHYLDGALLGSTRTGTTYAGTRASGFDFGDTAVTTTQTGASNLTTFEFSDAFIGTATAFTVNALSRIHAEGRAVQVAPPGVSVSHTAEPMYVTTSTLVQPTIIAVIGDHVEITTSILVSAYMTDPGFSAGENVTLTSEAILVTALQKDVTLETNRDVIFTTTPGTASANIVEALVSRRPMLATATLPMPVVYVSPNYFTLVKNHNPVIYIEDGQQNPVNHGSWNVTSWTDSYFDVNVQAGEEMNAVGNQKSWMANANGVILNRPEFQANVPNYQTTINNLYATKTLSIETWYWSKGHGDPINYLSYEESGPIFDDGITQISEVWDFFGCVPGSDPTYKLVLIAERVKNYKFDSPEDYAVWRTYPDVVIKREAWNHLVVTYEAVTDPNQIRRKIYLNGGIVGNEVLSISNTSLGIDENGQDLGYIDITLDQPQNIWSGPMLGGGVQLSGSQTIKLLDGVKLDEFAIYPITLSASQVVDHYSFIRSLSPDTEVNATAFNNGAQMGNHIVTPVMNVEYQESPFSALAARIPEPVIIGGKSKNIVVDAFEATAESVYASASYGFTNYVTAITAYAEEAPGYALNSIYADYVNANVTPYRYVNFDTANAYLDQGSDEDYAVPAVVIGGTVVNPDEGINGKSVKTNGDSYTSGVVLMESEYNDTWGTGQTSYHSSFWFQRAIDDTSTTGARILWNLNGAKDNQHVILYQYQNKLWLNFNNGSGTHIEQGTVANIDLFDYNRHFIVVGFDHSNPNSNAVHLYVDGLSVMTVNLGSYTGQTINSDTYLSPNDPANNYPRLGVGCLITPFVDTALSVVPTTTKLYIDEVIWAKTAATPTLVANLYNTLPGKQNVVVAADPMLVADELVMPAWSTEIVRFGPTLEAFAEMGEATITTEFNNLIMIPVAEASATMIDTMRSDSVNINAELMLASAIFNSAGTPRLIIATPITASAALQNRKISSVNSTNYPIKITVNTTTVSTFDPESAWSKLLRTSTVDTMDLIREVV